MSSHRQLRSWTQGRLQETHFKRHAMQSKRIDQPNGLALGSQRARAAWRLVIILWFTTAIPSRQTEAQVATTFNQIEFTIQTGGDDLRKSSSAIATLKNPHGDKIEEITLKGHNQGSFDNNSTHKVSGALNRPLTRKDIGEIVIELQEHNGFGQSDDNWNVQSVAVTLSNKGRNETLIMYFSGDPLVRLTGQSHTYRMPQRPRGPAGTYNMIEFAVHTGSDDIRGDSSATVTLMTADSATLDVLTLKGNNGTSWGNNSNYTISLPLTHPKTPAVIQHVAVTLQSHDKFGETPDNWNVEALRVTLSNDGVDRHELVSGSGPEPAHPGS
jgi:hypothetical protein